MVGNMKNITIKHNLNILSFILIILLLGSCCPADAKSIKIRGTPGYVYSKKTLECPPVVAPPVTESVNVNSTAQNTTASKVSEDTGINNTVTAVLPASPGDSSIAAPALTTETNQPLMLASAGGGDTTMQTLPALG